MRRPLIINGIAPRRRQTGSSGPSASRILATIGETSFPTKQELQRRAQRLVKLDVPSLRVVASSRSRRFQAGAIFPTKMPSSPMRRVWWVDLSTVIQVGSKTFFYIV